MLLVGGGEEDNKGSRDKIGSVVTGHDKEVRKMMAKMCSNILRMECEVLAVPPVLGLMYSLDTVC